MALPKFTIYKHVKLEYGWRYCKAAFHSNGKIKPDIVVVNGGEKAHREGAYYLNHNQMWIPVGGDAKEAEKERRKRLNSAEYHRLNGITAPEARPKRTPTGIPLQIAIDAYLEGIERAVASRNKRKGTLDLARTTLRKFSEHSKVQYLSDITVAQGSRVSIQGMSRHKVSLPTLCPLGQPNKAIGLESPIEPWLANALPVSLQAQSSRTGRTRPNAMSSNLLTAGDPDRHAPAKSIASASRGWMSEKHLASATQEGCFLLTSPLIEHFHRTAAGSDLNYAPVSSHLLETIT